MELRRVVDKSEGWWCARGSQAFQLTASDAQLQAWLPGALPPEAGPYFLVVVDVRWRKELERNEFHLARYPVDQLLRCQDEAPEWSTFKRRSIFIGSAALTPDLLEPPEHVSEPHLLVAGLLQLGGLSPGARDERRLRGIQRATYAREVYGGGVVKHDGYAAVLRHLRLELGRRLRDERRAAGAAAPAGKRAARTSRRPPA